MGFSDRIEQLLTERNEKRTHLAELIGVTNQSFTDWKKRGTIPSADIALKIAKHFDVTVEYLLTGELQGGISPKDMELLYKLHNLSPANQNAIISLLETLNAQEQKSFEKKNATS